MYKSGSAFFSCTTTTRSKNNWFLWATQQLCACIILFSIFLWRSLHHYWVKSPSSTFNGGSEDEHTTTISNFFFNLDIILKDSTPNRLHLTYWPVKIDPIWFKRTQIHFFFWRGLIVVRVVFNTRPTSIPGFSRSGRTSTKFLVLNFSGFYFRDFNK